MRFLLAMSFLFSFPAFGDRAQTLDQALRESVADRSKATEYFREKYVRLDRDLDPFGVPYSKPIQMSKKQKKSKRTKRIPAQQ